MITYSRQNTIDLCPSVWNFNQSLNRFYNWLNQPIEGLTSIPPYKIKLQFYAEGQAISQVSDYIINFQIFDLKTGLEIPGISYVYNVPSILSGELFDISIDLSLLPVGTSFYCLLTVNYVADDITDVYQSSCYHIQPNTEDKLIKIEYSNTVTNRPINGLLFTPDTSFLFYMYANKYDTEIEVADDESENDYKGNITLIEKTHQEHEIFELIDIAKKRFMALITISENDIIYINGRRAQIAFDKATECRIGTNEIPFINALMRVTYADDNGLLDTKNNTVGGYLNITDDSKLLINSDDSKLKIN